ncbi:excinuclease ABC subunit UvrC [Helicovermis profundi]|uniref:UvrABC system protein C n=1 Tax=Helicovermis profundi TaxID=3065157 RepID=A0AAU9E2C4_9FIRM|nr:excinuclease ABC subunit UvrC [Clostridia bacterium S502]
MFDIKEQLKKLPDKPGVYLMKDKRNNIIYVGKSKCLKNRVSSYFRGFNSHAPKVQTMVVNIEEFEYIITDTEMEALILEQTLIKKYKPRFNIALKDDKQYPYVKITIKEDYPRVFVTRRVTKDKSLYFGPYTNVYALNQMMEIIHKVYPIRKCNKKLKKSGERPCLNFHIKQCIGPCTGNANKEEYDKYIREISEIFSGKYELLFEIIKSKMTSYAEKLNFEKAAEYRDIMNSMRLLSEKQKAVSPVDINQDVFGLYSLKDKTCIMCFFVRGGKIIGREKFVIEETHRIKKETILSKFVFQYYSGVQLVPKEILLPFKLEDGELFSQWINNKTKTKVNVIIPQKGEKKKLINMVVNNAIEYLDKFEDSINIKLNNNKKINDDLKEILNTDNVFRIESYDISNMYGVYSVGSMVVYEGLEKKRTDYRRFKIKTIEGPNDYGSMQEILFRRFERGIEERKNIERNFSLNKDKFIIFPDLLLIDGGKGHVNAVLEILSALKLNIPVIGMVKNDKHQTEKLYYNNNYYNLKEKKELYKFIYGVQEEVHRFAINYHRNLRSKEMTQSILEEIDGIGKIKRMELLKEFKSIENIKNAKISELRKVSGITEILAKKINEYFNTII